MTNPSTYPFSFRLAAALISIALILGLLSVATDVFIPLTLAFLFAILLRPMVAFLQVRLRFHLVLAVSVAVIFGLGLTSALVYYISMQVGSIASDWMNIKVNLLENYRHLQQWVEWKFGISFLEQNQFLKTATKDSIAEGKSLLGSTLNSFTGTLLNAVLVPFYTFLLLLHRNLLIVFLLKLFSNQPQERIHRILSKVKKAVQSFLVGTLMEMGIVSVMTSAGLMIIGMHYAILLGILTGILNLIPYIGILVATLLTLAATLTGKADLSIVFGVVIVNGIIHLFDANVLVPLVVSSKVKMNAFISVLLIILGSHLAGVAGMFLAIPIAGILKIVFDEVEGLEPWGFLMGDSIPPTAEWQQTQKPGLPDAEQAEQKERVELQKHGRFLRWLGRKFG
jgi:predicted PurR-regulated permease PerM